DSLQLHARFSERSGVELVHEAFRVEIHHITPFRNERIYYESITSLQAHEEITFSVPDIPIEDPGANSFRLSVEPVNWEDNDPSDNDTTLTLLGFKPDLEADTLMLSEITDGSSLSGFHSSGKGKRHAISPPKYDPGRGPGNELDEIGLGSEILVEWRVTENNDALVGDSFNVRIDLMNDAFETPLRIFSQDYAPLQIERAGHIDSSFTYRLLNGGLNTFELRVHPIRWTDDRPMNNVYQDSVTALVGDLEARELTATGYNGVPETRFSWMEQIQLDFRVLETRGAPIDTCFRVLVYRGDEDEDRDTLFVSDTLWNFEEGEIYDNSITLWSDIPGEVTYTLEADTDPWTDFVPENNSFELDITTEIPDLAVLELEPDTTLGLHETKLLRYTWANLTNLRVFEPFRIQLVHRPAGSEAAETVLEEYTYESLEPGFNSGLLTTPYTFDDPGDHRFVLRCVTDGWTDRDTLNNETEIEVYVNTPDLVVSSFTAAPTLVLRGETVQLEGLIEEIGGAPLFQPAFFTVHDQMETFDTLWVNAAELPNSVGNRGTPFRLELDWHSFHPGDHIVTLSVDPGDNEDANLDNNSVDVVITHQYHGFHAHPSPFTPNQDTYNDTLYFNFMDDGFSSPRVMIYTIDGKVIRSLDTRTRNHIFWNGLDQVGRKCLPGAYLYVLDDNGKKAKSGLIYLVR
ncbi:hypothetical protein GF324_01930, partial [bacterium]|nr:hypothetical protein [bacterium]